MRSRIYFGRKEIYASILDILSAYVKSSIVKLDTISARLWVTSSEEKVSINSVCAYEQVMIVGYR